MKRHCPRLWQSSLAVGDAGTAAVGCMELKAADAVVGIAELKAGMIVAVVGAAKTVDVVSMFESQFAVAADGIGAAKTVAVASRVELKTVAVAVAVAAAAGVEPTKTVADAGGLLSILRPHAGTGDTGLEQGATDCVSQRIVAGVIGEFDFAAIRGA
jgi:hypothetical protein